MKNQSGIALVKVLLVTSLLLAMGAFSSRGARTELRVSLYHLQAKQALAVAEAGLDRAIDLIQQDRSLGFATEISSGGTGGRLQPIGSVVTRWGRSWQSAALGDGVYHVRIDDNWDESGGTNNPNNDTDGVVRVVSRGISGAGDRTVEALARIVLGPECALNSNVNLSISGNTAISGTNGCAHSNDSMNLSGSAAFQVAPTSSGNMTIGSNSSVTVAGKNVCSQYFGTGGCSGFAAAHSQWDRRLYPTVRPFQFGYRRENGTAEGQLVGTAINLADAVRAANGKLLDGNCKAYDNSGDWRCTESTGSCAPLGTALTSLPGGWSCDKTVTPTRWSVGGGSADDGVYFVEGQVSISGSPGSSTTPWRATIIALSSIDSSGRPTIAPNLTTGAATVLDNVLLVSGNDIRLRGTFGVASAPGAIFAHQQINFAGTTDIWGYVLAEDGRFPWPGDPAPTSTSSPNYSGSTKIDKNEIQWDIINNVTGSVKIRYSGLDTALYPSRLTVLGWHSAGY